MHATSRLAAFLRSGLAIACAASLLVSTRAEAKIFRNAYVSFELADRWNCVLEQTEWVCRTNQPGLAEALIVLTAKEVGPQDTLMSYEGHLKTPRTIVGPAGAVQSTVYKVEQRNIATHTWVDGMHLSSEVANYYTRYLATTKEKIAVLVTFSAHKLHYTKYSADFFRAIESLRVIATRSLMNQANGANGANGAGGILGGPIQGGEMQVDMNTLPDEGSGSSRGGGTPLMGLALILGAAGAFLLLKRKNKKKR